MDRVGRPSAYFPWLFVFAAGVGSLTIEATRTDVPGDLRGLLFAGGTVLLSIGSVGLGRTQASADVQRLVRPMAGPAFRRTFSLYRGLGSNGRLITKKRAELRSLRRSGDAGALDRADAFFEVLHVQVLEQLQTSNDAAAEWEQLLPTK